jgi:hypothetical protein
MPRADHPGSVALLSTSENPSQALSLRNSLASLGAAAKTARETGACGAASRWLAVAVIHGVAGAGLVLGMLKLYFGSAAAECHGAVLISCEDDQGWEWNLDLHGRALHEQCSSFATTANHSLHELCSSAKSRDGVLAEDACRAACSSCGMSRFFEILIAGAPIWARNALLGALVVSSCAKLSGFERRSGVFKQLLWGRAVAADAAGDDTPEDGARDAGWNAIVGRRVGDAGPRPQPCWAEARHGTRAA